MSDLNLALALVGGFTLVVSLATGLIHSRNALPSESMLGVLVGVLVGPHALGVLPMAGWGDPLALLEQLARFTVAIAVMSIALRLPQDYFVRRARSMAALLGPGMVLMWLASGLVVASLLDVEFWLAMLLGAVVTPTDPVLASSIVVGEIADENIPSRIRRLLSGEAGANDGLAYPFVLLPILLLGGRPGTALTDWVVGVLLWAVLGAVVLGVALGTVAGLVERWASRQEFLEETSVLTVTVALTFTALGLVKLLGSDGILAVFVAGLAYSRLADPGDRAEEQRVQEVLNRLFTLPIFVLFGIALPWRDWLALGWTGPAVVVGILLLRRLPMLFALQRVIEPLDRPTTTLFVGWFGPIGIAAIFYATLAVRETGSELVWTVASLVVLGSILAHGATATVAIRGFGRLEDDAEPETTDRPSAEPPSAGYR
jgi:NhaP-type Na+/H+ or K+/H+ antiporter